MKRGKIITIEGSDGTGKQTQTQRLMQRSEANGYRVFTMSFPDYDAKWGKKVRQYLNGEFGSLNEADVKNVCWLYGLDREAKKGIIEEKLENGYNIIFDRYTESNLAHQGSKLKGRKREEMIEWIKNLENKVLGLPVSDHVIFLDLPAKYSIEAMKEREISDIHEANLDYLKQTYSTYKLLSKQENWITIPCVKGVIRKRRYTIDELTEKIWGKVQPLLVK